jgi:hypothetical protein
MEPLSANGADANDDHDGSDKDNDSISAMYPLSPNSAVCLFVCLFVHCLQEISCMLTMGYPTGGRAPAEATLSLDLTTGI